MSRVSRGITTRNKHKRVLRLAKGYRGRRSVCIRIARQAVTRSMNNAYSSRRLRRRVLRRELILFLNYRARCYGTSYKHVKWSLVKLGLNYNTVTLLNLLRGGLEYDLLTNLFLFCSIN
ncbi:50S ribosomal subunit protein L20 [Candidatus Hodgkinia cicadicola]|nr:50S ribosomal subunit protein L20 [Candidatus Hodgkinia cicadicola]